MRRRRKLEAYGVKPYYSEDSQLIIDFIRQRNNSLFIEKNEVRQ